MNTSAYKIAREHFAVCGFKNAGGALSDRMVAMRNCPGKVRASDELRANWKTPARLSPEIDHLIFTLFTLRIPKLRGENPISRRDLT